MANVSTSSPPTLAAIEARSLIEAATRSLARQAPGRSATARAAAAKYRIQCMSKLLELMGLVRTHREDHAEGDGVNGIRLRRAARPARIDTTPVDAERRALLEQRHAGEG